MYVRLGFAIAAHLEPDVLLVDEVLAVGDAEFQARCLSRIQDMQARGTTTLFISHDLSAVERLCDRAILLEDGAIVQAGLPGDVVADYHRRLTFPPSTPGETVEAITTGVTLTNLTVHDPERPAGLSLRTGQPLVVSIRYLATRSVDDVEFELRYYAADGQTCLATSRTSEHGARLALAPPGGEVEFACDALPLKPGAYFLGAVVRHVASATILAWWDGETRVYVEAGIGGSRELYIPHRWSHAPAGEISARRSASAARRA
jgi:ABC-type microcin C transport system duplicated ATPase subunit YejF